MAFGFQSGAFQFGAFQQRDLASPAVGGVSRGVGRRNHYSIRGKQYLLSNDELYYVLSKLLESDKAEEARRAEKPKPKKAKAKEVVRVRAPREWTPPPAPQIDWGIWRDLVVEAKHRDYPIMLDFLRRYDDDEDVILLLYG